MTEELINKLREITPEEQKILEGHRSIEKELYMDAESDVVDARKLLDEGKLIQVRAHTRFAHFPAHRHNYVEMIYMCRGQTHHVIKEKMCIYIRVTVTFEPECGAGNLPGRQRGYCC